MSRKAFWHLMAALLILGLFCLAGTLDCPI